MTENINERPDFRVVLTAEQFAALEEARARAGDKRLAAIRQGLKWYCANRGVAWPDNMPAIGGDRRPKDDEIDK